MADFKSDLAAGKLGEQLLHQMWPELEPQDGKHFDFLTPDGEGLEVKMERRSLANTPNLFVETVSDKLAKKPGGPYQSFGRGATLYCFIYQPDKVAYIYRTIDLIAVIESGVKLKKVEIRNRSWITVGVLIPRDMVKHLLVKTLTLDVIP